MCRPTRRRPLRTVSDALPSPCCVAPTIVRDVSVMPCSPPPGIVRDASRPPRSGVDVRGSAAVPEGLLVCPRVCWSARGFAGVPEGLLVCPRVCGSGTEQETLERAANPPDAFVTDDSMRAARGEGASGPGRLEMSPTIGRMADREVLQAGARLSGCDRCPAQWDRKC
jgi:hypothetical protein